MGWNKMPYAGQLSHEAFSTSWRGNILGSRVRAWRVQRRQVNLKNTRQTSAFLILPKTTALLPALAEPRNMTQVEFP